MKAGRSVAVAAVIATALSLGTTASAQPAPIRGFAVDRFDPSERGSDWFTGESLDLRGHGRFSGGAVGDYNHDALVTRSTSSSLNRSIVSDQLVLNLGGNAVLWDRVRVGLNLPVVAYATGEGAASSSQTYNQPNTSSVGDTRVATDLRLFGEYGQAITGALGFALYAPTGSRAAYTSDGTFRITPRAMFAGKVGFFEWSARAGYAFRPEQQVIQNVGVGSEVQLSGAAGVRFLSDRVLVGPEVFTGLMPNSHARTKSLEVMLGAHAKITDSLRASLGGGAGLTTGFGTPGYRMMAGIEWAPGYEQRRSPPQVMPEKKIDPPAPPPTVVAVAPPPPPPPAPAPVLADRDNDGVMDVVDQCPDEPGPAERQGCPLAMVKDSRIVIGEQIKFRTGSAELDPASDPILVAVSEVMVKHPEIALVRVEGHTDTKGQAQANVVLSRNRAAAVAKWLATHSVDDSRLKSAGFGASQPLATNATEEGRRENRRVEFHIVEASHASR